METIYEYVQAQITSYPNKELDLKYRQFNQYETLNQIVAYTDSHYTSSQTDQLDRRKPFYNISNRILHKQRTAEDIDTKDINLTTQRPDHYAKSLLMSVANKKWMKVTNFALTLNRMTETRGKFGGLLVKKIMNEGVLDIQVADLSQLITDPVDIESGTKIDPQSYNAAELMAMKKNGWENVEEAITINELDESDENTEYIKVYVIDGVLPRTYIDMEAEKNEFSHQMHVITLFTTTDDSGKEKTEGITLYQSETKDNVYKYLPYENVSGRSLGRGMVEQSFQAQQSINEAIINQKNTMDVAGKVLMSVQGGSGLEGSNIMSDYVDGTVIKDDTNTLRPLTFSAPNLSYNQTIVQSWEGQNDGQSSVRDVNTGDMPASSTFRGMALQNQEANSLFELRREEMAIFLQEIYQDWVIPYLKKWVKTQEFMEMELSAEDMQRVIEDYSYNVGQNLATSRYFDGKYDNAPAGTKFQEMALDADFEAQAVRDKLRAGKKNWIKSDSKYLDGIEFDLDILITDEQQNKQVFLSNQVDALNSYLANMQLIQSDPNAQVQMNAILNTMGQPQLKAMDAPANVQGQPVEIEGQVAQA